jgi:hypothetical protein
MWEDFNDVPVPPRVASQSSSPIGVRDNHTLLCQTYHLDKVTPTWNTRRDSQAMQWKTTVIPRLIPVYLANRTETDSGRVPPYTKPVHQCQYKKVELKVELITWDRKFPALLKRAFSLTHVISGCSQKILSVCKCYPASIQLLDIGYFPCAPVRPTLAFDINLLELVTIASHYMALNVTGWSSSLQEFLSIRGYPLGEKVWTSEQFLRDEH